MTTPLASLETRVRALERGLRATRRRVQEHDEYIDTVSSALWKRIVWWFMGYRFSKVGRWYGH